MALTRQYFYVAPPGAVISHSPLARSTRASRKSLGRQRWAALDEHCGIMGNPPCPVRGQNRSLPKQRGILEAKSTRLTGHPFPTTACSTNSGGSMIWPTIRQLKGCTTFPPKSGKLGRSDRG